MGRNACLLLSPNLQQAAGSCRLSQAPAGSRRLSQALAGSCRLLQALAGSCRLLQALAASWLEEFKIRGSTFHDLGKRDRASFGTWQNPLGKKSGFLPLFFYFFFILTLNSF